MEQSIFRFDHEPEALELNAVRIFDARLKKRGVAPDPECEIRVVRNEQCEAEEFRFSGSCGSKKLQLDCGSAAAFLYAAGKILRTGNYIDGVFTPGS